LPVFRSVSTLSGNASHLANVGCNWDEGGALIEGHFDSIEPGTLTLLLFFS